MHPLQIRRYDPRHVEAAQSMQRNFKEIMEACSRRSAAVSHSCGFAVVPAAELSLPGECRRG